MIDAGRRNILGVQVSVIDYEGAVERIIAAAKRREPCGVTALAVHGVMTGALDPVHRARLNRLDIVVPDGQPVRWALNRLHRAKLRDRVYGPNLTLKVCERAAAEGLPVYFYGSRPEVLEKLSSNLRERFPSLQIAGVEPSRFRRLTAEEKSEVVARIIASGAAIVFAGLGCPRQEVWAYEHRGVLPMPVLAVGAAFDFHAGTLTQAPAFLQRAGLEWAFRLSREPLRLWRRYLLLNPAYVCMLALQYAGLLRYDDRTEPLPIDELRYG